MPNRHEQPRTVRDRLTAAALTGLIAGTVRAIVDWLLQHFTRS
ncbi:hypothetical protein ACN27F_10740 [Solwaraspora sp. WMMB335]